MPPCPVALYGPAPPKFSCPMMKFGIVVLIPLTVKAGSGNPLRKFSLLNPSRRSFTLFAEITSVRPAAALRGMALSRFARFGRTTGIAASSAALE